MNPKVLVGIVTYDGKDYCLDKFADALKSLDYDNYDIIIADNSKDIGHRKKIQEFRLPVIQTEHFPNPKDSMVNARNILRKLFLEKGHDYFLSVDSDIILPKDCIRKLLEPKKKVISGVYFNTFKRNGQAIILPILYRNLTPAELQVLKEGLSKKQLPEKQSKTFEQEFAKDTPILRKQLLAKDVDGDHIIEIDMCGSGCLLIAREVLEKITFRYGTGFDDSTFCIDAEKLGYKIYARTGVKCIHHPSSHWKKILPKR